MKFDTRTFTSNVSRRAFVLFIACALLPVSILAFISLRQVSTELRGQSERRLRQASKAVGLLLHRRLLALDAAIAPTAQQTQDQLDEELERPFVGVELVTADGQRKPVLGEVKSSPTLTAEQARHVAGGEMILSIDSLDGKSPRFFRQPSSGSKSSPKRDFAR